MLIKDQAKKFIDHMPNDVTLADIAYALHLWDKFERGEQQIREGLGIPHNQMKAEIRQWHM